MLIVTILLRAQTFIEAIDAASQSDKSQWFQKLHRQFSRSLKVYYLFFWIKLVEKNKIEAKSTFAKAIDNGFMSYEIDTFAFFNVLILRNVHILSNTTQG